MNSRRVKSSIAELQKDINNCELLVNEVVNGKVDNSKSNTLECDTSSRKRSVMTYVTAPREKSSLSPPCKLSSQKPIGGNRLLCKEVFENDNATVEVTVKAKTSAVGKSRKRLRSTPTFLSTADGISKIDQKNQFTNQFDPLVPSKLNRKGQSVKKVVSTKNKHLSWDHILKDNKATCSVHDSKGKQFASNSNSDPVNRTTNFENSCTSNGDSVRFRSRSVQCYLLEDNDNGFVKHETNPPVKSSEKNLGVENSSYNTFSVYNPVRILHFLIKELHSKINNLGNDNLQRIITDMEEALIRISPESNTQEFKENINNPVKDNFKSMNLGFVPIKPAEPSQLKNVIIQKPEYPKQKLRNISDKKISVPPSKPYEPISPPVRDKNEKYDLLGGLEIKCVKLESDLNLLEEKSEKQRKEKESLIEQVKRLEEQLELVISREKDYLTTIGYLKSNLQTMRQKTEDQAKSICELSSNNNKLKEENKALTLLRERETVLEKYIQQSTEKEGKVHAQLQIMKLEQEKFHILLAGKNSEVQKLKQELRDIQSFVSKQLSNIKSHVFNHESILNESFGPGKKLSPAIDDSDVESAAHLMNGGRRNDKPVCSSPTSSIPSSSGINSSWQKISRISSSSEKDSKKSSQDVLTLLPPKTRKLKKSGDEIDILENSKSFPLMKSDSLDFRSFLLESLSETGVQTPRDISHITKPKSSQELKDDWRDFINKIKMEASKGLGVSLPSPPHNFSEMSEPGGMSQWSDVSDVEFRPSLTNIESTLNTNL